MPTRNGLRFLTKVYRNLSPAVLHRTVRQDFHIVPKESSMLPVPKAPIPQPISIQSSVDARLQRIEGLLEKLLLQKRVRTVERDEDDLVIRVVDQPMDEAQS